MNGSTRVRLRRVKSIGPFVKASPMMVNLRQVPQFNGRLPEGPVKLGTGCTMLTTLIILTLLNKCAGEVDKIKSQNEVKNEILVVGDSAPTISKNSTADAEEPDIFDRYLNNHVIRIKSPFDQSKFYDFELKHLIREDTEEGRKKREGLMRFLLPIFVAIKMKLHSLVVLMSFVAAIAIKGFVAGATALLLSKLIGLKLLLQKQDGEKEEENEDNQDENAEAEKPIVVYLNSDQKWARNGYEGHATFKEHYYPHSRNWKKYENLRKQKWANSPYWRQQPWR